MALWQTIPRIGLALFLAASAYAESPGESCDPGEEAILKDLRARIERTRPKISATSRMVFENCVEKMEKYAKHCSSPEVRDNARCRRARAPAPPDPKGLSKVSDKMVETAVDGANCHREIGHCWR